MVNIGLESHCTGSHLVSGLRVRPATVGMASVSSRLLFSKSRDLGDEAEAEYPMRQTLDPEPASHESQLSLASASWRKCKSFRFSWKVDLEGTPPRSALCESLSFLWKAGHGGNTFKQSRLCESWVEA